MSVGNYIKKRLGHKKKAVAVGRVSPKLVASRIV
jgi:hypothetical protein